MSISETISHDSVNQLTMEAAIITIDKSDPGFLPLEDDPSMLIPAANVNQIEEVRLQNLEDFSGLSLATLAAIIACDSYTVSLLYFPSDQISNDKQEPIVIGTGF